MRRYESNVVKVKASVWASPSATAQETRLEVSNGESRSGWHPVDAAQPSIAPCASVLLARAID